MGDLINWLRKFFGIRTVVLISREDAIERLVLMEGLFLNRKYREIERQTAEPNVPVHTFLETMEDERVFWIFPYNTGILSGLENVENFTNVMILEKLNEPYYRFSCNERYIIVEEYHE